MPAVLLSLWRQTWRVTGARVRLWHGRLHLPAERRPLLIGIELAYGALLVGFLLFTHSWPAPDLLAIMLLLLALLAARGVAFLRDWSPFVLLLLGYVALTGVVPGLLDRVHIGFPITADRLMFGGNIPALWLQQHLFDPDHIRWYDYAATLLYPMHFVVPLLLAFALWMWKAEYYWKFVIA